MTDERFKAWLTFWQFVLGTVVLGLFSTIISHQIQTREVEIKEQEANAKFLEQALQEDVGVRRRLAQYFSHVTRSAELRARWADYAKIVEHEYQVTLAEKVKLQAAMVAERKAQRAAAKAAGKSPAKRPRMIPVAPSNWSLVLMATPPRLVRSL